MINRAVKGLSIIFLAAIILYPNSGLSRSKKDSPPLSLPKTTAEIDDAMKVHNIGKLWTATSNYGVFGDPEVPGRFPSYEWPGGSNVHYNWEGRVWFGALVGGEKYVSHADYGNYELHPSQEEIYQPWVYPAAKDFLLGWSGANPIAGPMKSLQDSYVVYDDLQSNSDVLGIKIFQRGLAWSTNDYDDLVVYEFEVVNIPGEGESVLNDFFISWCFDADVGTGADPTSAHIDDLVDFDGYDGDDTDTDEIDWVENVDWDENGIIDGYDDWGVPYGLQYHGSPNIENPEFDPSKIHPDGFFDEYTVIVDNNGPPLIWQKTVNSIPVPGGTVNATAGSEVVINGETIHGYVVPRNMSYMYDGDDPTTPGYDASERSESAIVPGYIGGRIIYSEKKSSNPIENIPTDEIILTYSHMWWNWNSDPGSDIQKYDFMSGTHADAKGKMFMPHPFDVGAPEFDYRWLQTTGPFDGFAEGDTLRFIYATGVGYGLRGLRENMDNALVAYYKGSQASNIYEPSSFVEDQHWKIPVPPPVPDLTYSPLDRGAKLAWNNKAESEIDEMLGRVDFEGYKIYRAKYTPEEWELIYACDNIDGDVKVIDHTTGDSLTTVDLPDIRHTFIDTGGSFLGYDYERPVDGLPYFYVVTAYDPEKLEENLPSIESARANFMTDPESGAPAPVTPERVYSDATMVDFEDLDIRVVPNPYRGTAIFEEQYHDKIMFTNLPPQCKISVFTPSGDLVKMISHTDGSSTEFWDLVSRNDQDVVSGLYLYVVEVSKSQSKSGKFVIIR